MFIAVSHVQYWEYETMRNSSTTSKPSSACPRLIAARKEPRPGGQTDRHDLPKCGPVVARCPLPHLHTARTKARASQSAHALATAEVSDRLEARGVCVWVCGSVLDFGADRPSDLDPLWGAVSDEWGVVCVAPARLELPKTPTPQSGARGSCHCPLETLCLAAYKKSASAWGPRWFSLMKAGFP